MFRWNCFSFLSSCVIFHSRLKIWHYFPSHLLFSFIAVFVCDSLIIYHIEIFYMFFLAGHFLIFFLWLYFFRLLWIYICIREVSKLCMKTEMKLLTYPVTIYLTNLVKSQNHMIISRDYKCPILIIKLFLWHSVNGTTYFTRSLYYKLHIFLFFVQYAQWLNKYTYVSI